MNKEEQEVCDVFKILDIPFQVVTHKAVYTAKDSDGMEEKIDGQICKNLFLKEEKETKYYLVSLPLNKRANIKEIEKELQVKKLKFGTEEELYENLKIQSGSVSLLNIIKKPDTKVEFLIDEELLNYDKVCFHPNDNHASIIFPSMSISKIMNYYHAKYQFLKV